MTYVYCVKFDYHNKDVDIVIEASDKLSAELELMKILDSEWLMVERYYLKRNK